MELVVKEAHADSDITVKLSSLVFYHYGKFVRNLKASSTGPRHILKSNGTKLDHSLWRLRSRYFLADDGFIRF